MSEVIKVKRLDAAQCLVVALGTYRTEYLAMIIGQQLMEDVDAKIARSSCEQNVADRLALTIAESVEMIDREEGIKRCKMFGFRGIERDSSDGIGNHSIGC